MEGTKLITETLDLEIGGRKASRMSRSMVVRSCESFGNENPDISSSIAELEPQPSKGLGFASNVDHLAVSRS